MSGWHKAVAISLSLSPLSIPARLRRVLWRRGPSIRVAVTTVMALVVSHYTPVHAQVQRLDRKPAAVGVLFGRHGFGLGVELDASRRAAVVLRAEGWPQGASRYAVAGGGVRLNALIERTGTVYLEGAFGWIKCTPPILEGPGRCADYQWHGSYAGIGGLELALDERFSWSAGIEGGFWASFVDSRKLDHLVFAAIIRYRP